MEECLFCRIVRGEIPSKKVYEDDLVLVFHDISPQAAVHVLIIPKQHVMHLDAAEQALDDATLAHILRVAARVARDLGLQDSGYRIVSNCGAHARQSVEHLHFHLLGGKRLDVKMG